MKTTVAILATFVILALAEQVRAVTPRQSVGKRHDDRDHYGSSGRHPNQLPDVRGHGRRIGEPERTGAWRRADVLHSRRCARHRAR
jgi:hypothetical protein